MSGLWVPKPPVYVEGQPPRTEFEWHECAPEPSEFKPLADVVGREFYINRDRRPLNGANK